MVQYNKNIIDPKLENNIWYSQYENDVHYNVIEICVFAYVDRYMLQIIKVYLNLMQLFNGSYFKL